MKAFHDTDRRLWILTSLVPFILLLSIALPSCGAKRGVAIHRSDGTSLRTAQIGGGVQPPAPREVPGHTGITLQQALNEIRALDPTEGVDQELFARLKAELERLVLSRVRVPDSAFEAGDSSAVLRLTSKAPTFDTKNQIELTVTAYGLKWNEARAGDWNNDGFVDAHDIVPIALHFGSSDDPLSPNYFKYAEYLDGDGNHTVDLGEIASLARHFGESTGGYYIYQADDSSGTGSVKVAGIARPPVPADPTEPPSLRSLAILGYDTTAGPIDPPGWQPVEGKWYQVVPVDTSSPPEESSSLSSSWVQSPWLVPLVQAGAEPTSGYAPLLVNFMGSAYIPIPPKSSASQASDIGGTIVLYEWDFESDGKYDWSDPTKADTYHTYYNPGSYTATLRVTDNDGITGTASVTITAVASNRGDWYMFGRDQTHSRRSPFPGCQAGNLRWRFGVENQIKSSPVIGSDETVYIMSYYYEPPPSPPPPPSAGPEESWYSTVYLYAIRPNKSVKWRYPIYKYTGPYSSPAIGPDGTIYVSSFYQYDDYYLNAIESDGTLKWQYDVKGWVGTPLTVGPDGTVYLGTYEQYFGNPFTYFYAVKPDGTLKWRYETEGSVFSSPAIGIDGTIYVGSNDRYLYAFNPDGKLRWRYETEGAVGSSSPAIGPDGTIYVGSRDKSLYAIRPNGTLRWKYLTEGGISSSPAIASDGTVYIGSRDTYLYALSQDGVLNWRYKTGDETWSSPAIGSDGMIYSGSDDDCVYAINPDGSQVWKYQTGGDVTSSPAIASDGTVYVGSEDGYLYAFNDTGQGPTADLYAIPTKGQAPLLVTFDAGRSSDPDGSIVLYEWDFDGDGHFDDWNTIPIVQHTFTTEGSYEAMMRVTDDDGFVDTSSVVITVGAPVKGWAHLWGDDFDEENTQDISQDISIDQAGNIVVTGYTYRYPPGKSELFLLKYDTAGNLVWAKSWGTEFSCRPRSVGVDRDGNILVAGEIYGSGAGSADVLLMKYDTNGNLLWVRTWGGMAWEQAYGVAADEQGNIFVGGATHSFGAGNLDALLLKLDSSGNLLWSKTWGGSKEEWVGALAVDSSGNAVVAGYTSSLTAYGEDALLLKYDSAGDLVWAKTLGSGGERANALAIDTAGSVYCTINGGLLKLDRFGEILWQKAIDRGYLWDLALLPNGEIVVAGEDSSPEAVLLARFESDGTPLSATTWSGGLSYSYNYPHVALDSNSNVFVASVAMTLDGVWQTAVVKEGLMSSTIKSPNAVITDANGIVGYPIGSESSPVGLIDWGGERDPDTLVLKLEP